MTLKTCAGITFCDANITMKLFVLSIFAALLAQATARDAFVWRDSNSVLNNLDQFDALYVTYHNCA